MPHNTNSTLIDMSASTATPPPSLMVPTYGFLLLQYLSVQDTPQTLTEICDRIAYCIPEDDWDVGKSTIRFLLKILLDHKLIVYSRIKASANSYEIAAFGRNQLSIFQQTQQYIAARSWELGSRD
jgi:hypothetical protein